MQLRKWPRKKGGGHLQIEVAQILLLKEQKNFNHAKGVYYTCG